MLCSSHFTFYVNQPYPFIADTYQQYEKYDNTELLSVIYKD